jgi:hypothetical protein
MTSTKKVLTVLSSATALALGGFAVAQTANPDTSNAQDSSKMNQSTSPSASTSSSSSSMQASPSTSGGAGDTSTSTTTMSNSADTSQNSGLPAQADRN